jgi:hypothetical protein
LAAAVGNRFQVNTDDLHSAGGAQRGLGDDLLSACGTLSAAGSAAAAAAGCEGGVAGAVTAFAESWANSLAALGGATAALAANVDAAAVAYEGTDRGAMPQKGRRG